MYTLFSIHQRRRVFCCFGVFLLLALSTLLAACGANTTQLAAVGQGTSCPSTSGLQGSGSTFDNPLFSKMFAAYAQVSCGIGVSYLADGSGAGMNDLLEQNVDFAATDIPLTDANLARSQHGPILHIPVTLGSVAVIYHVPGVLSQLKLTGSVLANIFLGKITSWNDPAITQLNPGVSLPSLSITVLHRSDGSGTTGIFTHYLAQVGPQWSSQVGAGYTVNWPVGIGFKGNGGVADGVQDTNGSIGYVEFSYALRLYLPYAEVQNAAGQYVAPTIEGALAAAASFENIPADLRFYIVNAPGATAYPISGFSCVIVYQQQDNADKGWALANLFWWMIHDGQQFSEPLHYTALPDTMVAKSAAQIRLMTCGSGHTPCYRG
jgi:phosphate transport system substrate-binding protein